MIIITVMKVLYWLGLCALLVGSRRITYHSGEIPPVATDKVHPEQIPEIITVAKTKKVDEESFLSIPATSLKRRLLGPL